MGATRQKVSGRNQVGVYNFAVADMVEEGKKVEVEIGAGEKRRV